MNAKYPECVCGFAHDPAEMKSFACRIKPMLAETPAEALRMTVAGRRLEVLAERQAFDSERLQASPLFKSTIPNLFRGNGK